MGGEHPTEAIRITGPQGRHDLLVLRQRTAAAFVIGQHALAEAGVLRVLKRRGGAVAFDLVQELDEQGHIAALGQQAVEFVQVAEIRTDVMLVQRLGAAAVVGLHGVQLRVGDVPHHSIHAEQLQGGTDGIDLVHLGTGQPGPGHGALTGLVDHQPLTLQHTDGFAHGGAADAENIGVFCFNNALIRRDIAVDNGVFQLGIYRLALGIGGVHRCEGCHLSMPPSFCTAAGGSIHTIPAAAGKSKQNRQILPIFPPLPGLGRSAVSLTCVWDTVYKVHGNIFLSLLQGVFRCAAKKESPYGLSFFALSDAF